MCVLSVSRGQVDVWSFGWVVKWVEGQVGGGEVDVWPKCVCGQSVWPKCVYVCVA